MHGLLRVAKAFETARVDSSGYFVYSFTSDLNMSFMQGRFIFV